MFSKKSVLIVACHTLVSSVVFLVSPKLSHAHGYASTPISREYQSQLLIKKWGWNAAHQVYENIISNPQSLESGKGFPEADLDLINDFDLDNPDVNRGQSNQAKLKT